MGQRSIGSSIRQVAATAVVSGSCCLSSLVAFCHMHQAGGDIAPEVLGGADTIEEWNECSEALEVY